MPRLLRPRLLLARRQRDFVPDRPVRTERCDALVDSPHGCPTAGAESGDRPDDAGARRSGRAAPRRTRAAPTRADRTDTGRPRRRPWRRTGAGLRRASAEMVGERVEQESSLTLVATGVCVCSVSPLGHHEVGCCPPLRPEPGSSRSTDGYRPGRPGHGKHPPAPTERRPDPPAARGSDAEVVQRLLAARSQAGGARTSRSMSNPAPPAHPVARRRATESTPRSPPPTRRIRLSGSLPPSGGRGRRVARGRVRRACPAGGPRGS